MKKEMITKLRRFRSMAITAMVVLIIIIFFSGFALYNLDGELKKMINENSVLKMNAQMLQVKAQAKDSLLTEYRDLMIRQSRLINLIDSAYKEQRNVNELSKELDQINALNKSILFDSAFKMKMLQIQLLQPTFK